MYHLTLTAQRRTAQLPTGSFGADYSDGKGRAQVTAMLDRIAADGMNFVRMWAFTVRFVCMKLRLACAD